MQEGEPTLNLDHLGVWAEDAGLQIISTVDLGLPAASVGDDAEAMALVKTWKRGPLELPLPAMASPATIDASIQGVVRRDVLEFYLNAIANHLRPWVVVVGRRWPARGSPR